MALLLMMEEWTRNRGGRAVAMTVDHAIRPESAGEADKVAQWTASRQIEYVTLRWPNPQPEIGALQSRARAARYELLAREAWTRGILHLATAHHADDQGETLLLRLAKGSGVDGLAGMDAILPMADMQLLRPLLGFPAARLKATCIANHQEWVEDPSNASRQFARPRLREARPILEQEGLTTETLCRSAASAGRARAALELASSKAAARCVQVFPQGYARIDHGSWRAEDAEPRRRILAGVVQAVGGENYPPSPDTLNNLKEWLEAGQVGKRTLAGCVVQMDGHELVILRELRNFPGATTAYPGAWLRWDRFLARSVVHAEIIPLGERSLGDFRISLPRAIASTQPAFLQDGRIVAVPTVGFYARSDGKTLFEARFSPRKPVGDIEFAIV